MSRTLRPEERPAGSDAPRPPSPVERARAVAAARAAGSSLAAIAGAVGLSVKQVRRYEALAALPPAVLDLVEVQRLPMSHAVALVDAEVSDPVEWALSCLRHRWTAAELRREIRRSLGLRARGRPRTYVRRERNAIRVYAFRISRSAPGAERERVIRLLEEAIAFLRA